MVIFESRISALNRLHLCPMMNMGSGIVGRSLSKNSTKTSFSSSISLINYNDQAI